MKKTKKNNGLFYILIVLALIIGIIAGFLITQTTFGKAVTALDNASTIKECCYGLNSDGLTYNTGIQEGCCILINMGYPDTSPLADSCTTEQYDQEGCNTAFREIMTEINK
jgi:hypothetical protein